MRHTTYAIAALVGLGLILSTPQSASAGNDFEKGFKRELGAITAQAAVGLGVGVIHSGYGHSGYGYSSYSTPYYGGHRYSSHRSHGSYYAPRHHGRYSRHGYYRSNYRGHHGRRHYSGCGHGGHHVTTHRYRH